MDFLSIIGTRPQFIKLAPISHAFERRNISHSYIDSGQHYDRNLSRYFIDNFSLNEPLKILDPGKTSPLNQIANWLIQMADEIVKYRPKHVLVYGDTNTAVAASIVCMKLGISFSHIEAGLRSGNLQNQEERNRRVIDHAATFLFPPTKIAFENLVIEGLGSKSHHYGDVMVDLIKEEFPYEPPSQMQDLGLKPFNFFIATLHRSENVDYFDRLREIFFALQNIDSQLIILAHPRLRNRVHEFKLAWPINALILDPVNHREMLGWVSNAKGIITDSGGLPKECFILGRPCTTLRSETEWPETLEGGMNSLVDNLDDLSNLVHRQFDTPEDYYPFGDGTAAIQIVDFLIKRFP